MWLVAVARGVLAGTFAISAVAKLTDPAGTRVALRGMGLPAGFGPTLALVEAFCAFGLLMERRTPAAAWVTLALLAAFTAFVVLRLAQGRRAPCPCFGARRAEPIGGRTLARNLALIAVAVVATGSVGSAYGAVWLSAAVTAVALAALGRRGGASTRPSAG